MGNWKSVLRSALVSLYDNFSDRHAKILMLGLDAAGKTTVLYKLKLNEVVNTIPTIGFNVESVQPVKNVTFTVWDIGGQHKIRSLWTHYFIGSHGLIYVVDSTDRHRFEEAKEELSWILGSDEMVGVPLVVLANKQDLPNASSPADVAAKLGLHHLKGRTWYVHGTSAVSGDGLLEAIQELSKLVKEFQNKTFAY